MQGRLLWSLAVLLVVFSIVPATSQADASLVQDSCVVFTEGGKLFTRVWFSIVNFSLPTAICDLHIIPEPQPPLPQCEMLDCGHPMGWACILSPLGGADWFASTPNDCIPTGGFLGGFNFLLDPGFCCYIVQFTDATGAVILEQEECFCAPVPTDRSTWGKIKSLYQE